MNNNSQETNWVKRIGSVQEIDKILATLHCTGAIFITCHQLSFLCPLQSERYSDAQHHTVMIIDGLWAPPTPPPPTHMPSAPHHSISKPSMGRRGHSSQTTAQRSPARSDIRLGCRGKTGATGPSAASCTCCDQRPSRCFATSGGSAAGSELLAPPTARAHPFLAAYGQRPIRISNRVVLDALYCEWVWLALDGYMS